MSAFILFNVSVKDPNELKEYAIQVPATLKAFDGALLAKGSIEATLAGEEGDDIVGIFSFPTIEKAHLWYNSDEYQALVPQREKGAYISAVCYQA